MKKCDIIIPIYNAYDCLSDCIDSVLKNTNFKTAHLILIDDKSTDKRVLPLLKKYQNKNKSKITLLVNKENLGFVATTNRGMKYSNNDVLLLNSDTIVPKMWLENMKKCAESTDRVATVTPFSNNLTPVSLPEKFRKKGAPDGWTIEQMADLVQKYSMHLYPEVPTAHGFCMFIKRDVINKVGYFDEEVFGRGYGEENDFCFRCLRYGYRHLFCDDVYVFHRGTQSFLGERKFHDEELAKKYPTIMERVGIWFARNSLKKIVDNVLLAIGTVDERINILVLANKEASDEDKKNIIELSKNYNLHILSMHSGRYIVYSYFKDIDLATAIYEKDIDVWGDGEDTIAYERIMNDIKKKFKISFTCDIQELNKKMLKSLKMEPGKLDFGVLQKKMLEYNFVDGILTGENIEKNILESWDRISTEENNRLIMQERKLHLTIPKRVYLKIRYILLGR